VSSLMPRVIPIDGASFSPGAYTALMVLGPLLLVHVPGLAAMALAEYTGAPVGGFAPRRKSDSDMQGGFKKRPHVGSALSALACVFALTGSAFSTAAIGRVANPSASTLSPTDFRMNETNVEQAELCFLVWGVESELRSSPGTEPRHEWLDYEGRVVYGGLIESFHPESANAQEELRLVCDVIRANSYVTHSDDSLDLCLGEHLHRYVRSGASSRFGAWPVPEADFVPALLELLQRESALMKYVGFRDAPGYPSGDGQPTRVAWIKVPVRSKQSEAVSELFRRPDIVAVYRSQWYLWFAGLPSAVRSLAAAHGLALSRTSASTSVLRHGFPTCASHAVMTTLEAFLSGLTRALLLTPAFALVAMLVFLRDVFLCYGALYTIVSMMVSVLGLLHLINVTLGPIESVAFALVIGVSVDYIVHFAHAFKHSLMAESYYKSRAVLFARSGSVFASGMTTLAAVLPLLASALEPLRVFGMIFAVVAVVALFFAMGFFNAFIMVAGQGVPLSDTAGPGPGQIELNRLSSRGRCSDADVAAYAGAYAVEPGDAVETRHDGAHVAQTERTDVSDDEEGGGRSPRATSSLKDGSLPPREASPEPSQYVLPGRRSPPRSSVEAPQYALPGNSPQNSVESPQYSLPRNTSRPRSSIISAGGGTSACG